MVEQMILIHLVEGSIPLPAALLKSNLQGELMSDKKTKQLGMNPSTASHRLVKDLLWKLIETTGQDACCKCGEPMSRETFSIEHVTPWLDSDDPVGLYFDLDNVGFSHLRCNIKDAKNGRKIVHGCGTPQAYDRGCRCKPCVEAKSNYRTERYCPEQRSERYRATGH